MSTNQSLLFVICFLVLVLWSATLTALPIESSQSNQLLNRPVSIDSTTGPLFNSAIKRHSNFDAAKDLRSLRSLFERRTQRIKRSSGGRKNSYGRWFHRLVQQRLKNQKISNFKARLPALRF